MEGVQRSLDVGGLFIFPGTRRGAAVPDVLESGGVRENKLSLPQSRAVVGKISQPRWLRSGRRVADCESNSSAGTKRSFYCCSGASQCESYTTATVFRSLMRWFSQRINTEVFCKSVVKTRFLLLQVTVFTYHIQRNHRR